MIFQKGDLVKLDVGVHIKGALGDNALTVEVGNGGEHTDQILVELGYDAEAIDDLRSRRVV